MDPKDLSLKYFWRNQELEHENNRLRKDLSRIKSALRNQVKDIEETQDVLPSGKFAFFHVEKDGEYTCVGTGDPYEHDELLLEDVMNQADLIIPIPDHTTVKEFEGF